MHRFLVFAAALAAAVVVAAPGSGAVTGRLVATVGPGPILIVEFAVSGRPARRLPPGTYHVLVRDRSIVRNFHLVGPGVNKASSVRQAKTTVWTVKLRKGVYRFYSDPQRTRLKGTFRVV